MASRGCRQIRGHLLVRVLGACLSLFLRGDLRAAAAQTAADAQRERALQEADTLLAESKTLLDKARYDRAIPLAERAVILREQALDSDRPALAEALDHLGRLHELKGSYTQSLPLLQRGLDIREKTLGLNHPDVAQSLHNLATLHASRGEYAQAEALHRRALVIREQALGPEHPDFADSLVGLGTVFYQKGDYAESQSLLERAVPLIEKSVGAESAPAALALAALGRTLAVRAEYGRAQTLFERALVIQERTLDAKSPVLATTIGNLAALNIYMGHLGKAQSLFERALPMFESGLGAEDRQVAVTLQNLAVIADRLRDYAKAEPLYIRSLAVWEKALGPEHAQVAYGLNNLAGLYQRKGDYVKAEPLYRRALAIREKADGPDHPQVAYSLTSLGGLLVTLGKDPEAESYFQRALTIEEKALGPQHPLVAATLQNLAALATDRREYDKAELLYRRALTILEQALGPEHPDVGQTLNSLARFHIKKGDFARAEPLYRRALEIGERTVGATHPDVAISLNGLATVYRADGHTGQAVSFLSRYNEVRERNFERNLPLGSERQKLSYLELFSQDVDSALSLHAQSAPDSRDALQLAFTTLLRRKGRAVDATSDNIVLLRDRARPEDQAMFTRLSDARSRLASLILGGPGADAVLARAQRAQAEEEVDKLEAELSAHSAAFRAHSRGVALDAVQSAIPSDAALIEFARYHPTDARNERERQSRYAAYVLTASGPPRWVDLGDAAPIENAVEAWRRALRDPRRADASRLGRVLDSRIMQAVRGLLGATQHVLVSPDGPLNLIPFAALVDENGKYLVERYTISYLTSGRDLLRLQVPREARSAPVIVADPAFGEPALLPRTRPAETAATAARQVDYSQIFFGPLPGVRDEVRALETLLPEATFLTKGRATKAALQQVTGPRILHIATHGFFLQDDRHETRDDSPVASDTRLGRWVAQVDNPLLRSGLALAGANQSAGGNTSGILTALEASSLDLWGTKLVVLSACDTGVGEVKNGDGVYGLRRALVLAGAESQMMSLWAVSDRSTGLLMTGYYRRLRQQQGRSESLRRVQLQMLKSPSHRHPYYWASIIQSGEWASLDGKR